MGSERCQIGISVTCGFGALLISVLLGINACQGLPSLPSFHAEIHLLVLFHERGAHPDLTFRTPGNR